MFYINRLALGHDCGQTNPSRNTLSFSFYDRLCVSSDTGLIRSLSAKITEKKKRFTNAGAGTQASIQGTVLKEGGGEREASMRKILSPSGAKPASVTFEKSSFKLTRVAQISVKVSTLDRNLHLGVLK